MCERDTCMRVPMSDCLPACVQAGLHRYDSISHHATFCIYLSTCACACSVLVGKQAAEIGGPSE